MDASLRELNLHTSAFARRAQAGEAITITDRGRAIAELGPLRNEFRFANKAAVQRAFQLLAPVEFDRFRDDLDAVVDPTFHDPYSSCRLGPGVRPSVSRPEYSTPAW